jgi:hypothetical protein
VRPQGGQVADGGDGECDHRRANLMQSPDPIPAFDQPFEENILKRFTTSLLLVGTGGLLLAACSSGATVSSSSSTTSAQTLASSDCKSYLDSHPGAKVATTTDYVMVAVAGPSESMYTPSEATSKHPTSGEVMLSGHMAGSAGSMSMGSGSAMRHVEVHICSKADGKAVVSAMPSMDLRDLTAGSMSSLQVGEMQGLDRNPVDTHYGNNVTVVPGHHYQVRTTMNGQSGMFAFTATQA